MAPPARPPLLCPVRIRSTPPLSGRIGPLTLGSGSLNRSEEPSSATECGADLIGHDIAGKLKSAGDLAGICATASACAGFEARVAALRDPSAGIDD